MNRTARCLLIGVGLPAAVLSCALNRRPTIPTAEMDQLWVNPVDLEQRDLFYGPGSARHAPARGDRFAVKGFKTSGTQAGFDVEDAQGGEWSAKLGIEARVEVAMSRLVWAIGYHQPEIYYVPEWTLTGDGKDRVEQPARFRFDPKGNKKAGEWAWSDNPFVGTRQIAGLFVMMVIVNNWDLKSAQNPFYEAKGDDKGQRIYMVRDLGASLGKTSWIRFATKDDPDAFEKEPFIDRIEDHRVVFYYQGGWLEPQLITSVVPEDVRWVCGLLSRLSVKQLNDAF